ncbi:phosphodiester glycosidase family protein [Nocardiopsis rhodophaea]|uniref:phosphodiester glycosidase family protein n=1 Tax=Nocardiopsis rhodophaea TaxID=280238 RepID=UPI0031D8AE92
MSSRFGTARVFLSALVIPLLLVLLSPAAVAGVVHGPVSETSRLQPVAPGMVLTSTEVREEPEGTTGRRQHFSTLSVDLGDGDGATIGYVDSGTVTGAAPLPQMVKPHDTAVAAVNGDYFDINLSSAPLGAAVRDGRVLKSPTGTHVNAATFASDGTGRIQPVRFTGSATLPSGSLRLDRLNSHEIPDDGVGAFTSDWGEQPRERATRDAERVTELEITDGVVRDIRDKPGRGDIDPSTTMLVGLDAAADRLEQVDEGDAVTVGYDLTAGGVRPRTAVGGRHVLLRDGRVTAPDDASRHPRTAIGFSAGGRRMYLMTADGRTARTPGATLREMAERMLRAGAADALELDGGGSSTLLAREPGATAPGVRNRTGGLFRAVPNGLVVLSPPGSGKVRGVWIRPRLQSRPPRGSALPRQADPYRVFSGLRRSLTATTHDEAFGPVRYPPRPESLRWSASSGTVSGGRDVRYTAGAPGAATVAARWGPMRGTVEVEVLPGPRRIAATPASLAFPDTSRSARFVLTGVAPDGSRAPIEPDDAVLDFDPGLVDVAPRADGTLRVEPRAERGTGEIAISVAGSEGRVRTAVPVRIGTAIEPVAEFDDAARWTASAARGEASVRPVPGRSGDGLALTYDFTRSQGTRAAYARPPAPIRLDRPAFSFGLWVRGDAQGAGTALTVVDAERSTHTLRGPEIDWTGWRKIEFPVPQGVAQPLTLTRLYAYETRAERAYRSELVFDDLTGVLAVEG